MAWAKKIGTPYVEDPVFQENFMLSLRERWPELFAGCTIADIDFREMVDLAQREKLANLPEEERKRVSAERKRQREELKARYGYAQVDDHQVEIGAYLVEPPGIFMGRGAHPLRGRWKPRVYSYQVTLNLDEDAPIPEAPHTPPGEDKPRWAQIVHEHDAMWVARWHEVLTDKIKYVWLAETSHLRQARDQEKYDKAHQLHAALGQVRAAIRQGMRDQSNLKRRKVATVAYLIDRLAMRVGDEKDEDEADTVGASTLRVEHVKFGPDRIDFDFLGKDSVRWEKSLEIRGEAQVLAKNLREFMAGKQPHEQIFPEITSAQVNRFLSQAMPGLTAKVFRTYHATTTVRDFLDKQSRKKNGLTDYEKEYLAKLANLEAAIKCNHKRTVPKTFEESLRKRAAALEKLRTQKPNLEKLDAQIKARQAALDRLIEQRDKFQAQAAVQLKKKQEALAALEAQAAPNAEAHKRYQKRLDAASRAVKEAEKTIKQKTKRYAERIAQAQHALEKAKEARARVEANYRERIRKAELQLELAQRTREYNLNTSLKNYIDPRVYRDWGQRVGFDWTKLYPTALKRKFQWAMDACVQPHDASPSTHEEEENSP